MRLIQIRTLGVVAATALLASALAVGSPPQANATPAVSNDDTSTVQVDEAQLAQKAPDRTIVVDAKAPSPTSRALTALPATLAEPKVGEKVRVIYTDAVAETYAVSATCTVSGSAGSPYKYGSRVQAMFTVTRSSGCGGTARMNGILEKKTTVLWSQQAFVSQDVATRTTWAAAKTCTNTKSTTWRSALAPYSGSSGPSAQSGNVTLACGT